MKKLFLALTFLAATPALAQAGDAPAAGKALLDPAGKRLGRIDRVLPDGSLKLIVGDKFVTVPATSVSVKDGIVSTSLTRRELSRM